MADPQTGNLGLYQPTHGSDVDTWDQPLNANTGASDTLFAGVSTISLTNANVLLTTPPNSGAAWSGPYQSQTAVLRFTGTLTGNCTITLPRAGFFIVDNQCVVGAFYVALASAAPGKIICAPPGAPTQIFCDGVDVNYVNLGPVGSALDLQAATALPAWMTACTRLPYLIKNGAVYNFSDYPALGRLFGSTFGGNGITTFAVPDELSRLRLPIDTAATGRVTLVGCGINGALMGSAGGDQLAQTHTHGITDPGHAHVIDNVCTSSGGGTASAGGAVAAFGTSLTSRTAFTGISTVAALTGASQNMVPAIVSFLPLVKT